MCSGQQGTLVSDAWAGSSRVEQQALETPVVDRLSPSRCSRGCETYLWKPIEELPYCDHGFQTGEGSPEAEMGSQAKGKMPSPRHLPMEIKLVGPLKGLGITMRSCNYRHYRFSLANEYTA